MIELLKKGPKAPQRGGGRGLQPPCNEFEMSFSLEHLNHNTSSINIFYVGTNSGSIPTL